MKHNIWVTYKISHFAVIASKMPCVTCRHFPDLKITQILGKIHKFNFQNGTIVCQHKEPECAGNRFESCVIENFANPFDFIYCFEEKFSKTTPVEDAAKKCYDELKVDGDVQTKIK
jgi:hypothetical protein